MKKTLGVIAVLFLVVGLTAVCSAQTSSSPIPVRAVISQTSALNVAISKIVGTTWTENQSAIDFGTLQFDTQWGIFRAPMYYAVDVGINSNAAAWTITHKTTPVATTSGATLDDGINVTFVRQFSDRDESLTNGAVSFAASNNKVYSKTNFPTGSWLRIYYGLATGSNDNPGVNVITAASKPAGTYSGSVTLTLTQ